VKLCKACGLKFLEEHDQNPVNPIAPVGTVRCCSTCDFVDDDSVGNAVASEKCKQCTGAPTWTNWEARK
jgi:hypothetical protein